MKKQSFHAVAIGSLIYLGIYPDVHAFNSEEHKLITDLAVEAISIPTDVTTNFPSEVSTLGTGQVDYLAFLKEAKDLAVGFDTNNQNDYDKYEPNVQDNCYWTSYGQLEYNRYIHIPDVTEVPSTELSVSTKTSSTQKHFSLGELSALYGDYRRTTHCSAAGSCYLTNADTPNVSFERGNVFNENYYCPDTVSADIYLRYIGSGVVPPFGTLGNSVSNSANDDEYHEASWWGDEMIRIANVNDWHFSNAAVAWYIGAHRLALDYANLARVNPQYWVNALHYEASALHSLVDLFAFGHVVTSRGESSHGIMKNENLDNHSAYQWMEQVISLGGGQRASNGKVTATSTLPAVAETAPPRNDFMASDRGTWTLWANTERSLHDTHNDSGATVKNLNGTEFYSSGDGKLKNLSGVDRQVIIDAVKASVESLFTAYVDLQAGTRTLAEITASGSASFNALTYLPAYIVSDSSQQFTGRWTRYAKAIDEVTGTNALPTNWEDCIAPYLYGNRDSASTSSQACTTF